MDIYETACFKVLEMVNPVTTLKWPTNTPISFEVFKSQHLILQSMEDPKMIDTLGSG